MTDCGLGLCNVDNTACLEDELAKDCVAYEFICITYNGADWRVTCNGEGKAYIDVVCADGKIQACR